MTNLLPVGGLPLGIVGFQRFDDVQPFSIRSHASYENIQWEMVCWLRDQLTPYLENESQAVAALQGMVNTMTADILATGSADDIVIIALLQNAASQTREWLDARYLQTGNLDTALNNVLTGQGASSVRSWLNAHFVNQVTNQRNENTGWWHVADFGAVGDGVTDDRAAIQAAIDAASAAGAATGTVQRVHFNDQFYMIGTTNYLQPDGSVYGIVGINLKNYVELSGPATLQTKANSFGNGTFFALVRSPQSLHDAGIRGLTFDGNKANEMASTQCSGIQLECLDNVWVVDCNVKHITGNGIMLRGTTAAVGTNLRMQNNKVDDCTGIGIQSSQFRGLKILANWVSGTTDNAIDIYGENGSTTSSGTEFLIADNHITNCNNGIFLETVAQGVVKGNVIYSVSNDGIHVNRINGAPSQILITENFITNVIRCVGCSGVAVEIFIVNNLFNAFNTAGVELETNGSDVAGYYIIDNVMNGNSDQTALVLADSGHTLSQCIIRGTITQSKQRAWDFVNYATATANVTSSAATSPGD